MVSVDKNPVSMDDRSVLQMGRTCIRDAELCETKGDYLAAARLYKLGEEMFGLVMERSTEFVLEARSEYMHTLFRQGVLPQLGREEKMDYLVRARQLNAQLLKEISNLEFEIAAGCIQDQIDELELQTAREKQAESQREL
ncbi:MAG: hypothetical protein II627_03640 [Lachnospiraceae bacterium]|nr:hypothetical protein [Lachnospiraceae bacterium]